MKPAITIQLHRDRFSPGERLSGHVHWQLEREPREVRIRLFWRTSGRGTEDVAVVAEQVLDRPAGQQGADFAFALPLEPYSFEGQLVALHWGIEVLAGGASAASDFTLAPGGTPRRLANA